MGKSCQGNIPCNRGAQFDHDKHRWFNMGLAGRVARFLDHHAFDRLSGRPATYLDR